MPGTLYIVATPIGNLADISQRAKDTLARSAVVCCEDTRVTSKLLAAYDIRVSLMAVHQHSDDVALRKVLTFLLEGKEVSLVTDAGTPGISDPGGKLVALAAREGITISPIPGPNAAIAALSVSGFPTDVFTFLGFPPQKKGRAGFFAEVAAREETVVLYESTHRIMKTLAALPQDRLVMCARELTKLHETLYRGSVSSVLTQLQASSTKGEFVLVLAPKQWKV